MTDLFHVTKGRGRPVVALHGGLGFHHGQFVPWLEPVADFARLVLYDHRGHERSPLPASWDDVDIASLADDADALCESLGLGRIVAFGHSYGGYVALELARRHPERLAGLVLSATTARFDHGDLAAANARARGTPEQVEIFERAFSRPLASNEEFAEGWRELLPLYFHRPRPSVVARIADGTVVRFEAFNRGQECLAGFDATPWLGEIRAPTLVLDGAHDWIMPPERTHQRLVDGIPGARGVVFERSGHYPFVEEPYRFFAILREWLAGLPR